MGQSPFHCGSQVVYARCQRAASVELFAAPVSCGGAERLPLMSALKCLLFIRRGEIRLILKSLRKEIDPQELEGGIIGGDASFSAPRSLRVCGHGGRPDQGCFLLRLPTAILRRRAADVIAFLDAAFRVTADVTLVAARGDQLPLRRRLLR